MALENNSLLDSFVCCKTFRLRLLDWSIRFRLIERSDDRRNSIDAWSDGAHPQGLHGEARLGGGEGGRRQGPLEVLGARRQVEVARPRHRDAVGALPVALHLLQAARPHLHCVHADAPGGGDALSPHTARRLGSPARLSPGGQELSGAPTTGVRRTTQPSIATAPSRQEM